MEILEIPKIPEKKSEAEQPQPKESPALEEKELFPKSPETDLPQAGALPSAEKQLEGLKLLDQQKQVKRLCEIALEKGLDIAVKAARELDNPFVLKEFYSQISQQGNFEQLK